MLRFEGNTVLQGRFTFLTASVWTLPMALLIGCATSGPMPLGAISGKQVAEEPEQPVAPEPSHDRARPSAVQPASFTADLTKPARYADDSDADARGRRTLPQIRLAEPLPPSPEQEPPIPSSDVANDRAGFPAQASQPTDAPQSAGTIQWAPPEAMPRFEVPVAGTRSIPNPGYQLEAGYELEELLQLALSNNATIQAANALRQKAGGLRDQVGQKPNPEFGYFGQQLANRQTDQQGLFISQQWVRGDKLAWNRRVLAHTQQAQSAVQQTQQLRVLTDVQLRYIEAFAAQQLRDAAEGFAETAQRGVELAEARWLAEEGTRIETLQSQTLLSEVQLQAEQAEARFQGAWQQLTAVIGVRDLPPAPLNPLPVTPPIQDDWSMTIDSILSGSPELQTARAILCEKQAILRRQQVQPIPNVTTRLGAAYDRATEHGMINVELSAPLPVWNKNRGNISAAYADYARASQNVERIEAAITARFAEAKQQYEAALAGVRRYEEEILPQAEETLQLSEQAYRSGELDFLQVLVVRRTMYEATLQVIAARADLAAAAARIDGMLLTGGLDAPADFTAGDGIRGQALDGL